MGMTRNEALKVWLPVIQMGVETMPECKEALDMAIDTMCKYQKIQEIIADWKSDGFENYWLRLISKEVEDGNE